MLDSEHPQGTQAATASPFLETRSLHKHYGGVHALKGVSLRIERGRFYHLLGENGCGKSTLIKIISGAQSSSAGQVLIQGRDMTGLGPIAALGAGIETVYQDLSLLPNLSVAENIGLSEQLVEWSGKLFHRLDLSRLRDSACRALEVVGLPTERAFLSRQVETLPLASRQLVAIARAVASEAGLVIMDEPTTSLTRREVDNLIRVIRRLQSEGAAVLFVTHKLDEARDIGGVGLVMRDGELVHECDVSKATNAEIGYWMTGRELQQGRYRDMQPEKLPPLLEVKGLSLKKAYEEIDLSIAQGEILGVTGLADSGRNELAMTLAGLAPAKTGSVVLGGNALDLSAPDRVIREGVAYVPEDRLAEGLFLEKTISENITMSILDRLRSGFGLVSRSRARQAAQNTLEDLQIVAEDIHAPVSSLSGGNQQRVLIGRWLAAEPRLLILHGPTVGVDVGSKEIIFRIIQSQADKGMGVLIVSDDLPELLQNCDKILVMRNGRIYQTYEAEGLDEHTLYSAVVGD
ncbi:sugar ABC transporter ATP-binding protein [Halomonas salipaludis]|uniref:Sugar ABC transporter ATP-binding protein n=1 Tax=Halomonas salipaludis TaxID=2032625 RepID=A0A2A2ENL9_9GAMM|nr:sugar ABC transporter ATP-binding protein [Halomonas salipaludis]PAU73975.1 sugar ABC transporter ATP-binding protein [Halomonas salipaludis]